MIRTVPIPDKLSSACVRDVLITGRATRNDATTRLLLYMSIKNKKKSPVTTYLSRATAMEGNKFKQLRKRRERKIAQATWEEAVLALLAREGNYLEWPFGQFKFESSLFLLVSGN